MRHNFVAAAMLAITLATAVFGQSDFHTYPVRTITALIDMHSDEASRKADIAVSANPFPSKSVVTFAGEHRAVEKAKKDFMELWFQTKGVEKERAELLLEEYKFTENGTDHWLPVIKDLVPFVEKELKKGDKIEIYFFFLGGYGGKGAKKWVLAVEEFKKM